MACEGVGLILDNVFAVMQRVKIMAILFGFPSFPGCHWRLQWHHICLWPDWQWEVIHHAGSCGSFYTERHNTQSIWTHFWERTGKCVTMWKRPDCVISRKTFLPQEASADCAWEWEWGQASGYAASHPKAKACVALSADFMDLHLRCLRTESPYSKCVEWLHLGMKCQERFDWSVEGT